VFNTHQIIIAIGDIQSQLSDNITDVAQWPVWYRHILYSLSILLGKRHIHNPLSSELSELIRLILELVLGEQIMLGFVKIVENEQAILPLLNRVQGFAM